MKRSQWKGPFIKYIILKKFLNTNKNKKRLGATQFIKSRNSTILPTFLGSTLGIYNGKKYISINIVNEMIGYKLGEFSYTRNRFLKSKKKKTKKN